MLLAVIAGAAIVRHEHRITSPSVRLRAVAASEPKHVGGSGSAVNRNDRRITSSGLVANWLDENPTDGLSIGRLPADFFFIAECEIADLRLGVGPLAPRGADADLIPGRACEQ